MLALAKAIIVIGSVLAAQAFEHVDPLQLLGLLSRSKHRRSFVLAAFYTKEVWRLLPFHPQSLAGAERRLKAMAHLHTSSVEVVAVALSSEAWYHGAKFASTWWPPVSTKDKEHTNVLLFDGEQLTWPRLYRGRMEEASIAQFIMSYMVPTIVHAYSAKRLNAMTDSMPTLVACMRSPSESLFEEFNYSVHRRAGEAAAMLVTDSSICPFPGMPSVGFFAPGFPRKYLLDPANTMVGASDWLLNVKSSRLEEMTADNNDDFLASGGWVAIAVFKHEDLALRQAVEEVLGPYLDKYEKQGTHLTFATARQEMYGYQFGINRGEHGLVLQSIEHEEHPANTVILDFTGAMQRGKLKKAFKRVLAVSRLDTSKAIGNIANVVDETEASWLRDVFSQSSKEERLRDLDSVDGQPTYEHYIEDTGLCRTNLMIFSGDGTSEGLCLWARGLVQTRIMPPLQKIAKQWMDDKLMKRSDKPLKLCSSFIRRYRPMERRKLPIHKDSQSVVTVNVLLNNHSDFKGGLVVYPEAIDRAHLGPVAYPEKAFGEAVLHRADLYHGVKVSSGHRFSWIMWFRRDCSTRMEDDRD
mmetsp:Transcript_56721/g.133143  ORF Transcript_56721/g.133143 Transcript_56721/m.133143 type:complete len:581 (-) Transcript_56721:291-2033(-)